MTENTRCTFTWCTTKHDAIDVDHQGDPHTMHLAAGGELWPELFQHPGSPVVVSLSSRSSQNEAGEVDMTLDETEVFANHLLELVRKGRTP
jgi:hypothetical protein